MTDYKFLNTLLKDIALRSLDINPLRLSDFEKNTYYGFGASDRLNEMEGSVYLYVTPLSNDIIYENSSYQSQEINFQISVGSQVRVDEANNIDTISDTNEILKAIIAELSGNVWYKRNKIRLINNITIEPLFSRDDANNNISRATLTIRFPFKYNLCNIPIDLTIDDLYSNVCDCVPTPPDISGIVDIFGCDNININKDDPKNPVICVNTDNLYMFENGIIKEDNVVSLGGTASGFTITSPHATQILNTYMDDGEEGFTASGLSSTFNSDFGGSIALLKDDVADITVINSMNDINEVGTYYFSDIINKGVFYSTQINNLVNGNSLSSFSLYEDSFFINFNNGATYMFDKDRYIFIKDNLSINTDVNGIYSTDYFTPINDNAFIQKKYVDDAIAVISNNDYKWVGNHIVLGNENETIIHQFSTSINDNSIYDLMIYGSFYCGTTQVNNYRIYINDVDDFSTATLINLFRVSSDGNLSAYDGGAVYYNRKMIIRDNNLSIQDSIETPTIALQNHLDTSNILNTVGNRKVVSNFTIDTSQQLYFFVTHHNPNITSRTYLKAVSLKKY